MGERIKSLSKFLFFTGAILFITFFLIIPKIAYSGVSDGSNAKYKARVINRSLTPQVVSSFEEAAVSRQLTGENIKEKISFFESQTIFWQGRVEKFFDLGNIYWMLVKFANDRCIWVFAEKNVRNLDFDRTGYKIGIKGNLVFKEDRLYYIRARSVILIAPPDEMSYAKFREKYEIHNSMVANTFKGKKSSEDKYFYFIVHRIYMHNPHYSLEDIRKIASGVVKSSNKYKIDPLLFTALLNIESAFDVDAVSSTGAIGMGQLMPETAKGLGVDPYDVTQNLEGAAKYLHYQQRRWRNSPDAISLALASYNAGPGAVERYGGIPPYSETRNYVFFINFLRTEYIKQFQGK